MTTNLEKIKESLNGLTILELNQLVKELEADWGVSAAAPVAVMAAGGAPAAAEKTSFTVVLAEVGANKINVIKEVKAMLNLGLAESKTFVESAPKTLKEDVTKEEADKIKATLEAAGAKVEIK